MSSVFNFLFQVVIYHPIWSNNYNNVFPPALLLYSVSPGVILEEEQSCIAKFTPGIINLKQINIRTIEWRYISATRSWSQKQYNCFDFPAYSMFWGNLSTQVQPPIILDPDYFPDRLPYDYDIMITYEQAILQGSIELLRNVWKNNDMIQLLLNRRSCPQMFHKIGALWNFVFFAGKNVCWILFLIKLLAEAVFL